MEYGEFLSRIVDDGIVAARRDYADRPDRLMGAVAGFEACRGRTPGELVDLLRRARGRTRQALLKEAEGY